MSDGSHHAQEDNAAVDARRKVIEFFIPIEVKPKQSFRASRRGGYSDTAVKANAKSLAWDVKPHVPPKPLDCPVVVSYVFWFQWGPRHSKKFRSTGSRPKMTAPDLGNLEKQMDDVLELAGMVENDSRICMREHSSKLWGDKSGVWVEVKTR